MRPRVFVRGTIGRLLTSTWHMRLHRVVSARAEKPLGLWQLPAAACQETKKCRLAEQSLQLHDQSKQQGLDLEWAWHPTGASTEFIHDSLGSFDRGHAEVKET